MDNRAVDARSMVTYHQENVGPPSHENKASHLFMSAAMSQQTMMVNPYAGLNHGMKGGHYLFVTAKLQHAYLPRYETTDPMRRNLPNYQHQPHGIEGNKTNHAEHVVDTTDKMEADVKVKAYTSTSELAITSNETNRLQFFSTVKTEADTIASEQAVTTTNNAQVVSSIRTEDDKKIKVDKKIKADTISSVPSIKCNTTIHPRVVTAVKRETDANIKAETIASIPANSETSAVINSIDSNHANIKICRPSYDKKSNLNSVDGELVKKQNIYEVKGITYAFNKEAGQDKPLDRKAPQNSVKMKAPPKPRVVSQREQQRLKVKAEIEQAIQQKAVFGQNFLRFNLGILAPFLEPKVEQDIRNYRIIKIDEKPSLDMQPDGIQADLRDYQLFGLNWLLKMYSKNIGCILGDEMGLGKTLQVISLVCYLKQSDKTGPSLIICPLSVLTCWTEEIKKWAPSLKYIQFHCSDTEASDREDFLQYDVVITTYEMVKSNNLRNFWSKQNFILSVLDEGHRIKCYDTLISKAVRKIHSEYRMILSGTPLANNLVEMWNLLNFLNPTVFTTSKPFAAAFDLSSNVVDRVKLDQAHEVLNLFMLRRLKTEVINLPKKIETKIICPLSKTQIWWYKAILLKDINILARDGHVSVKSKFLMNIITQLRKCVNHPFLFPGAEDIDSTTLEELVGASGKVAVLDKLLCSLYRKNHRVVLFSQFTSMLNILEDYCKMRGWEFCRFDGNTARAKRNYVVKTFNEANSKKFLFLMSTRSGGMGLNLQTADTCILFDSDWNPMPDLQAMARVHRIGQKKTVHVYRLVTKQTIEERILESAEKKLYMDSIVTRNESSIIEINEEESCDKLMSALKFGSNAVFGNNTAKNNILPTDEEIDIITDRARTEEFSLGDLKGGVTSSADNFDAAKAFSNKLDFGGIDFKKVREVYEKSKPKDMGHISELWRKRQRKNRIKMIEAKDSGYGTTAVPVLTSNDYDLQTGEKSVFEIELQGKEKLQTGSKKAECSFINMDRCQACGDGGYLVLCPRCPVSLHLKCAGVKKENEFLQCYHHRCIECRKTSTECGGFMFRCSTCPRSFCEDHVPSSARFLDRCEQMEKLGYHFKNGVYIHCSKQCENVAIKEYGFKIDRKFQKSPCPSALDLSSQYGGAVDDSFDMPEDIVLVGGKRKEVGKTQNPVCNPSHSAFPEILGGSQHHTKRPRIEESSLPVVCLVDKKSPVATKADALFTKPSFPFVIDLVGENSPVATKTKTLSKKSSFPVVIDLVGEDSPVVKKADALSTKSSFPVVIDLVGENLPDETKVDAVSTNSSLPVFIDLVGDNSGAQADSLPTKLDGC